MMPMENNTSSFYKNNFYIDPNLIVNKQLFETVQDMAICSICTGLVIDPQQCIKCENCFCKICVNMWIGKSNTCPYKCKEWKLIDASRVMKAVLDKILIECPKNCSLKQLKYYNIISHINECESKIVNCPTCGSKVNEELICKESYYELKIQNEILKKRIEQLEMDKLNLEGMRKALNNHSNIKEKFIKDDFENEINILPKNQNLGCKTKKNFANFIDKKGLNKPHHLFIHEENSKSNFRFACCNKEYDCVNCHFEQEGHQHQMEIITSVTCKECLYVSKSIHDNTCTLCGVSFQKKRSHERSMGNVIKFKNSNRKRNKKNLLEEVQQGEEDKIKNVSLKENILESYCLMSENSIISLDNQPNNLNINVNSLSINVKRAPASKVFREKNIFVKNFI
jgi:hypothetical protein